MLIFLDIDGVLIPAKSWQVPPTLEDGFPVFNQKATDALQRFISDNTTVILSSSHRDRFTIEEWRNIFKKRGLNVNKLNRLKSNPDLRKKRKEEILEWFDSHRNAENFVIIDDDNTLNALPEHLKDHLILTSSLVGFTPDHIPQVEAMLHKGL